MTAGDREEHDDALDGRTFPCPPARVLVDSCDHAVVFRIEGEIDLSNADDLRTLVHAHISRDHDRVCLDLGGVGYLDSSSLRLLTELAQALRARRQQLVVVAPADSVAHRLLTLTGLGDAFDVAPEV
jgi:anti-sigma B factor antagonist